VCIMNNEVIDILVVEDNANDRVSIVDALKSTIENVRVAAVNDGTSALDFLNARGEYKDRLDAPPPRLILLDLSLPGASGFSVLGQIRAIVENDELILTPVVIFSDSIADGDITKSYRCGANSYIIKPLSFPDFQAVIKVIGQYWMTHNKTSV